MAVLTEHLLQLIAKKVDDKGLAVWYAPEHTFGSAASELLLLKSTAARMDRSFLALRRPPNKYFEFSFHNRFVVNISQLGERISLKQAKRYWDELMDGKCEWFYVGKQLLHKGLVK